ncbi:hypothetical protein [Streptomyces sp. NPDC056660]|uniref:hypothetical protein n=1 Tax=Streptomyces sp. NPDC056660 TaxID=3345897 RepID=UPI00367A9712
MNGGPPSAGAVPDALGRLPGQPANGPASSARTLHTGGRTGDHEGAGPGLLTAFADALTGAGHATEILEVIGGGAYAFAECRVNGTTVWSAAEDASPPAAAVGAVLSAVNRARAR